MKPFLLALLMASAATAMPTPVQQLPDRCTSPSSSCTKSFDSTSGVCRTIRYATSAGEIQVLVCDKGDHYELYRQSAPGGLTFQACTGGGCVDQNSGFASFTSTVLPGSSGGGGGGSAVSPLVDPNGAGFASETRSANHLRLVNDWWLNGAVVQRRSCIYGTCAWVPWYSSSSSCFEADLKRGDDCNLPGGVTSDQNCQVTDEFSQVFWTTAQSTDQNLVYQLVNTLRLIRSNTYGALPVWKASRSGSVFSTAITANGDTASDADARIVISLYIAANSPYFSAAAKADFKALADEMAAAFLAHDFVQTCRPGLGGGVQICRWLAGGGVTGHGWLDWNNFSYAGYYGDAIIALLAAHHSTGQATSAYLDAAVDTVNAYLLASNFNGTTFSVPPVAFRWNLTNSTPQAVCTKDCALNGWDNHDAVRAVNVCKAKYYADLAGVTLPSSLGTYCDAWYASGGITTATYSPSYTLSGAPRMNPPQGGVLENGLGLSLNFARNAQDLTAKMNEVGTHYNTGGHNWDWQPCLGIYNYAFFPTNLGTAIGRDTPAFRP